MNEENKDNGLKIIKFPTTKTLDLENYDESEVLKLVYKYATYLRNIYIERFEPEDETDDEIVRMAFELQREFISVCFNELNTTTIPLLKIYLRD